MDMYTTAGLPPEIADSYANGHHEYAAGVDYATRPFIPDIPVGPSHMLPHAENSTTLNRLDDLKDTA